MTVIPLNNPQRMIAVQTKRLNLRQWQASDKPLFAQMNADPLVMEYFPNTLSSLESDASVARYAKSIKDKAWGYWAAELIESNKFIGFIGMNYTETGLPFAPCVDIGWRLSPEYWGKGYATEGAIGVIDYAFTSTDIEELVSMTPVINSRSEKVMIKLGMVKQASNFMHPRVEVETGLKEHVLYTLKRHQWAMQRK